jgi:hypothetical protein
MKPAEEFASEDLVGKRVAFNGGDDHAGCWHSRVGLRTGVVVKVGQTLSQKAELLAAEGVTLPGEALGAEAPPRLWVKADPCASFPRGCETAVEKGCLLVADR